MEVIDALTSFGNIPYRTEADCVGDARGPLICNASQGGDARWIFQGKEAGAGVVTPDWLHALIELDCTKAFFHEGRGRRGAGNS